MKFIKKFVESAKIEKTQITQKDFDTLENIFLDLHDQDNLTMRQYLKTRHSIINQSVENSTLNNSHWPVVSVCFEFDVMKFITNGYSFTDQPNYGSNWQITKLGFKKKPVPHIEFRKKFIIRTESDISDLFNPKNTQPGPVCDIFNFLNDKFELGNKLKGLLDKSKGIEYYGFNWRIDLDLRVKQRLLDNVYIEFISRYFVTVENID